MATMKKNQKLCWNCEGEVDKDAIVCLFCGADLSAEASIPVAPLYRAMPLAEEPRGEPPAKVLTKEAVAPTESAPSSPVALFFLLPGAIFLLFSLLLVFFSADGVLTLQWSSRTWYLYFAASLPLFYFGYRLLP